MVADLPDTRKCGATSPGFLLRKWRLQIGRYALAGGYELQPVSRDAQGTLVFLVALTPDMLCK